MSEFTERMEQARADMMSTIRATDKQIAAIYDQAAKDLAHKAAGQKDGSLTKRWQLDMSQSLTERMNQLNGSVTNTVIASATTASRLPGNANADWLDLVLARSGAKIGGDSFRSVLTRTSDEALRQVVTGKAYLDSKSLSRRIWNNTVRGREAINEILQQGIAKKQSAYEMAKLLERYVNPKAWEDYDWRKVYPDMPSWLSGRWTSVEKHAQNVARTTINHAYHLSVVEAAKANPFTDAIRWELSPQHWERQVRPFGMDICDDYAAHDEGLGVGNWPTNGVPLPHAGCLCIQYAVVTKSLDQCASELKDWLQGGSNPKLSISFGEWKDDLQSGGTHAMLDTGKEAGTRRREATAAIAQRGDVQAMTTEAKECFYDALVHYSTENMEAIAGGILPNAGSAEIADGKMLYGLKLNADKATAFRLALGYGPQDAAALKSQIAERVQSGAYELTIGEADKFGTRYATRFTATGHEGKNAKLCTAWIVDANHPRSLRLTNAYIDRQRGKKP